MKDKSITIRIDSGKYEKLTKLAADMDRSKAYIIDDAIGSYIAANEWQIGEVKKALTMAKDPNIQRIPGAEIRREWEQRIASS